MPKILLDHVAVGVWKFADALPVVVQELGGRPGRGGPGRGFEWRTWSYANGGNLEILEPVGSPDGFLHRFLRERGPGIHHVTFYVPNLRQACDRAEANGHAVVGYDDSNPFWQEAFLHPRTAQGIVVQLASSSAEHEEEGYGWEVPPAPPGTPEPVRLLGMRMTAPDAGAARRLWEETVCGAVEERPEEIVFRWPDSPLRIAVTLDPAVPARPLCLEVETVREIPLLDADPPPAFGARVARARD